MPKISFRISDEELSAIKSNAENAGLTVSDFIRRCVLSKKIEAKELPLPLMEAEAVSQLRRIGGLLKQLWKEGNGADISVYKSVVEATNKIKGYYK